MTSCCALHMYQVFSLDGLTYDASLYWNVLFPSRSCYHVQHNFPYYTYYLYYHIPYYNISLCFSPETLPFSEAFHRATIQKKLLLQFTSHSTLWKLPFRYLFLLPFIIIISVVVYFPFQRLCQLKKDFIKLIYLCLLH